MSCDHFRLVAASCSLCSLLMTAMNLTKDDYRVELSTYFYAVGGVNPFGVLYHINSCIGFSIDLICMILFEMH